MAGGEESSLPVGLAGSRSLEKAFEDAIAGGVLNLVNRKLKEFPRCSRNYDLSDITQADLSRNRLAEVPEDICQFISLESLSLYHNCVRNIPQSVVNLQALTYLNISRNQLTLLPPCLCLLPLKVLIASNNKLITLPESIGSLSNLRQLDVSCNELQSLPTQIGSLESLRDLNIRRNQITALPEELSELPLVRLDFSCNRVSRIPVCYRHLRHLQCIILDNNPLQSPPAQICTRGKFHIFKYLMLEACNKTVQGLVELERVNRPTCLPDEIFPGHHYGGLDSGFNSVDSGSKRWSGNESADEFSDLSLRIAELSKEQKQLKESHSGNAIDDVGQIDFIDSSVNGDEEDDIKSDASSQTVIMENSVKHERTSSQTLETESHQKFRTLSDPCPAKEDVPVVIEERRRPETLQIWQERERQQALLNQTQEKRECVLKPFNRNSSGAFQMQSSSGISGASESSFVSHLRHRGQITEPVSIPASSIPSTQTMPRIDPAPSCSSTVFIPSAKDLASVPKPNSFLFRSTSKNNVKRASVSSPVHDLLEAIPYEYRSSPRIQNRDQQESKEAIAQLRKTVESRLNITLAEDLGEALSNGTVLCQLVNHMRPRSIAFIHVPSPAVPKLSLPKCRRNVENFIEACRKIGVPEEKLCQSQHILDDESLLKVATTVQALTDLCGSAQRKFTV
ncbi:leucine-rich repeat and calponin homology domain-containing protein 4 isoform X2 [Protopterus annectens]|uniref:leucine-rich repeat and calponin homology domain-containing protein 4 isoform X2 n=1 Tax=Protopterus annectens TaxID=7888 RepID=UPI001CFA6494|nr:leucine-rich repeat and calponin homology domain-containing protein 4 isoform X2 [Protopterus annectens]